MDQALHQGVRCIPCSMASGRQVLAYNLYELLHCPPKPSEGFTFRFIEKLMFVASLPGRVDNVYGDRNLISTLQQASQVAEEAAAATA
jgi:hypothetical protein